MTSRALGRLPNAPLAYVLAQVRFQPILEMDKSVPSIQTALRLKYPRYREVKVAGIEIGPNGARMLDAATRWEFTSASSRQGVILQTNSLVLHATEYSTYAAFSDSFHDVLKIVGDLVPGILVDRLGLRYIDFIMPSPGQNPDQFVVSSLGCRPDPGVPFESHSGVTTADYELADGHLIIRFTRGRGLPPLPPDLQPLSLAASDVMERKDADSVDTAILDTDRFIEISVPYDATNLLQRFESMHDHISRAFKAITTAHAVRTWSGPAEASA